MGRAVFAEADRVMGEHVDEGTTEAGEIYIAELDGSRFANGIYFLILSTQSGVMQTRKLILSK